MGLKFGKVVASSVLMGCHMAMLSQSIIDNCDHVSIIPYAPYQLPTKKANGSQMSQSSRLFPGGGGSEEVHRSMKDDSYGSGRGVQQVLELNKNAMQIGEGRVAEKDVYSKNKQMT